MKTTRQLYRVMKTSKAIGSWPFGYVNDYFDTLQEAERYVKDMYPNENVNILKYDEATGKWRKFKTIRYTKETTKVTSFNL